MKPWRLALRMLRQDARAGEMQVLALALMIAVASVSSVGFFTDRVQQALQLQANALLGADVVVAADHPLDESLSSQAREQGLSQAQTLSFLSMVLANGANQLADIKAVGEGYPLRGELRVAAARFAPDELATDIPAPGAVWADARLLSELGIEVGAELSVGEARLRVTAVVSHEPDRGGSLFSIAPRLLMNAADLAATDLLQPGSRVRYRLLVAGERASVAVYRDWVASRLQRGERVESVEDARPEMRTALQRARQFLGLASLVTVVLAGVAIATATRRYVTRHLDNCAMLRCLGAAQGMIMRLYAWQMAWLGLVASLAGCAVGYGVQVALADVLGSLAAAALPPASAWPVVAGLVAGSVTLLGFALPPLMQLREVPTLRVLRQDMGTPPPRAWLAYGAGLAALAGLMVWQAGDVKLGLYVFAGVAATVLALAGVTGLLLAGLGRVSYDGGVVWRFGAANIVRRARGSLVQVVAFGLGLMALLLLGIVRVDLLADWEAGLPADAHNRFVISIQPQQVDAVHAYFAAAGKLEPGLFPMIRGRLVAINEREVSPQDYADDRAQRLVAREFNLSWAATLQDDNRVVAGKWWSAPDHGQALWSVEDGIAATLGVQLGDTLTYEIGGERYTAKVANLRKVEWDSFHVNFFVIAPPRALDNFPTSYITSFHLPEGDHALLSDFVQRFPNVTVIDVAAIMAQVRRVMDRVSTALEYVFGFTLLAGVMVLYAAILSTLDERIRENAVLRTLGAVRRQLLVGMLVEFAGIGALAGLVGASAAGIIGYVLAERVFRFPYAWNAELWGVGIVAGALVVGVAGTLGTRFILKRPPWQTLRSVAVN